MRNSGDDLPALFRSLAPDDSDFQATALAGAREAEQRWPLFKSASPQKPISTPALSAQERQHWRDQEKSQVGERKPALSMPGLGDKLAQSLGKMSGRTAADVAPKKSAQRAEPEKPPGEPPRSIRTLPQETPPEDRGALLPAPPTPKPNNEAASVGAGLFNKTAIEPTTIERHAPDAMRADNSLASIFSRLEGKEEPINKPINRRSSFLSRLAKR